MPTASGSYSRAVAGGSSRRTTSRQMIWPRCFHRDRRSRRCLPAKAARMLGWQQMPLLDARRFRSRQPAALASVLLLWVPTSQAEVVHVSGEARCLRTDLIQPKDMDRRRAMIVVMRSGAPRESVAAVVERVKDLGFQAHLSEGQERTIIGVIGDERPVAENVFRMMQDVEKVVRILRPFKLASATFTVRAPSCPLTALSWGQQVIVMAGRARWKAASNSWKRRMPSKRQGHTSYGVGCSSAHVALQLPGVGHAGLKCWQRSKSGWAGGDQRGDGAGAGILLMARYADILQVGTRNMQNYNLLHAGGGGQAGVAQAGMMSRWRNCSCRRNISSPRQLPGDAV